MKKTLAFCILLIVLVQYNITSQPQWIYEGEIPLDTLHDPVIQRLCVVDSSVSFVLGLINVNGNYETPYFAKRTIRGWSEVFYSGLNSTVRARSIEAVDSNNIWLGTCHPEDIYYSSNGGRSWILQHHISESAYVEGIQFSKTYPQIGYAFADLAVSSMWSGVRILRTTNSGQTWQTWEFNMYAYHCAGKSMSVLDSNYAWFGAENVLGGGFKIISTTNGGLNWIITDFTACEYGPHSIQFSQDRRTGLFQGNTGPASWIYRTTNGGINWDAVYSANDFYAISSKWIQGTSNIYTTSGSTMLASSDNGLNWTQLYNTPVYIEDMDAVRINDRTIYGLIVTWDRQVYKLIDTNVVVGIKKQENVIPKGYSLSQNYPNPFNPATKIKFDIALDSRLRGKDKVVLKVYDVLGREVTTLVNKQLKPGTYEVDFDGTNYSSGVYYYTLTAGSFSQTKKMTLTK